MVLNSTVRFTNELQQGIISLLCMKGMERVNMAQLKNMQGINKSALLCPVNMKSVHAICLSIMLL